jgi:phage terminase small subunit
VPDEPPQEAGGKKPYYSPVTRATNGLTVRQENFCLAFVETSNATEAYRRAYSTANCKPATINRRAVDVLSNSKVEARIKELRAAIAQRTEVTIESLCAELTQAMQIAIETRQAAACIQATMAKAKLLGMVIDRSKMELEKFVVHAPEVDESTEEWLDSVGAAKAS